MSRKATSTIGIEEALSKYVGVRPAAQAIAMGIQSLGNEICCSCAKLQLKRALADEKYPLTKKILSKVFKEECGLTQEEADRRSSFVFNEPAEC